MTLQLDAVAYDKSNYLQRRDSFKLIDEIEVWSKRMEHPPTRVVDVGCGTGNITSYLSEKFPAATVIGIDKNGEMITFAKKNHSSKNVIYIEGDICANWEDMAALLPPDFIGNTDCVMSTYCLHWVESKLKAIENINNLLVPSIGRFFMVAFTWSDILPIYQEFASNSKWIQYFLEDYNPTEKLPFPQVKVIEQEVDGRKVLRKVSKGIPPFSVFQRPDEERLLTGWRAVSTLAGLRVDDLYLTPTQYTYEELEDFQLEIHSMSHLLPHIPPDQRPHFIDDLSEYIDEKYIKCTGRPKATLTYEYLTLVATKK